MKIRTLSKNESWKWEWKWDLWIKLHFLYKILNYWINTGQLSENKIVEYHNH